MDLFEVQGGNARLDALGLDFGHCAELRLEGDRDLRSEDSDGGVAAGWERETETTRNTDYL